MQKKSVPAKCHVCGSNEYTTGPYTKCSQCGGFIHNGSDRASYTLMLSLRNFSRATIVDDVTAERFLLEILALTAAATMREQTTDIQVAASFGAMYQSLLNSHQWKQAKMIHGERVHRWTPAANVIEKEALKPWGPFLAASLAIYGEARALITPSTIIRHVLWAIAGRFEWTSAELATKFVDLFRKYTPALLLNGDMIAAHMCDGAIWKEQESKEMEFAEKIKGVKKV